jgi:tetratricopeptide (TPR) repeat protein
MATNKTSNFFVGWSDFFLTVGEVLATKMRMFSLARRLVDFHYRDPNFRPWAKELGLAEMYERAARLEEAEMHYRRVIHPSDPAFGLLFLGGFYERQDRVDLAIDTFQEALRLSHEDSKRIEQLEGRLKTLRNTREPE